MGLIYHRLKKVTIGDNPVCLQFNGKVNGAKPVDIYYLLTGCKGCTKKYKPKVFHTARACEGCLENQGLVFPGTARAPS